MMTKFKMTKQVSLLILTMLQSPWLQIEIQCCQLMECSLYNKTIQARTSWAASYRLTEVKNIEQMSKKIQPTIIKVKEKENLANLLQVDRTEISTEADI